MCEDLKMRLPCTAADLVADLATNEMADEQAALAMSIRLRMLQRTA